MFSVYWETIFDNFISADCLLFFSVLDLINNCYVIIIELSGVQFGLIPKFAQHKLQLHV